MFDDDESDDKEVTNMVTEVIKETLHEDVGVVLRTKKRPTLSRSYSCDHNDATEENDKEFISITLANNDNNNTNHYNNNNLINCFINDCHCDYKKITSDESPRVVETINPVIETIIRKRRNSVQFLESTINLFETSQVEDDDVHSIPPSPTIYEDEIVDHFQQETLYSLQENEESLTDVNQNISKPKNFFQSIFTSRKHKSCDGNDINKNIKNMRKGGKKYNSAVDISNSVKPLKRGSSFLKRKISSFVHNEGAQFLKRSLSFRNVSDRRCAENSPGKLSKNEAWEQSLKSLTELDNSVSYKDLSFIDYDKFNSCRYDRDDVQNKSYKIWRTQSMIVTSTSETRKAKKLTRGFSVYSTKENEDDEIIQNNSESLENSAALSLPTLHYLNQDNNEEKKSAPQIKYQRRAQSTNSEDGRRRSQNNSFRSAGSGCAKLKRHNACRQKSRHFSLPDYTSNKPVQQNDGVRSRSLNHLDSLDMRQSAPVSAEAPLKDAKSEPDCTRPILTPSIQTASCDTLAATHNEPPQRRHMLSRSQKSSSECFSINFEVGDESTYDTELFFPASRGVTLFESLSTLCELRSIDLNACDAWLTNRDGNTQSWLSLSQDTACLVGRHVRIVPKDGANRSRLNSFYGGMTRKTPDSKSKVGGFFSSSTEDSSALSSSWQQDSKLLQEFDYKKQTKQRWSGLFGNSKESKQSMESLIEQLEKYLKFGVPGNPTYTQGRSESIDALYKLEDDWRDIIDIKCLSEKQQKQQTALWELIKTEVAYIKTLKVVTDLFLACLVNLQHSNILKEIDKEKLFSNISEIVEANVQFWRNSLFPLVRDMRTYKQPPCIETMCEGFLKIKDSFQAYSRFCGEQSRCQHYCRENLGNNPLFTAYLAWCETQKECNRLKLMDILVQPMQRLTKYGLLLKAILKNTDDEVESDNLNLMIRSVNEFVNNVNSSLKTKQDNERLKGIIARIESYDIVETKDDDLEKLIKSYNQLDLNRPMLNCPPERKRHLLLEGDLKLKDANTSKIEVHCFLLTDLLLVCKSTTKKGGATMKVIRQPYHVDRLIVTEVNKETPTLALIYKNELDMAVAAFLLQNNDAAKLKGWKDGILKAQNLYAQAKQISITDESIDHECSFEYSMENEFHCLQAPRSPLASSSRASRVSSLAHSHSGSVEMNDQTSAGSVKDSSRPVSVENDNRTASVSSDEGVQPLPPDKSPISQKNSFKHRLFNKTPNTLSVQPYTHGLGQSLPNLVLGSPNTGTLSPNINQHTLSVPSTSKNGQLLSPTSRGISYPPPSPTRGNLRRGLAISQSKNPPLIKTRHVQSTGTGTTGTMDFDVPVIAGISSDQLENFNRGQHRKAMFKRIYRNDTKRYHTAGVVDDIKKDDNKDTSIQKRLSWNCSSQEPQSRTEDQT